MNQSAHEADKTLRALGELQRAERAELDALEERASELSESAPAQARAFEDRLMQELFAAPASPARKSAGTPVLPSRKPAVALTASPSVDPVVAVLPRREPAGAITASPSVDPVVAALPRREPVRPKRRTRWISAAAASCAMAATVLLWVAIGPATPEPFELTYTLVPPAPDAQFRSGAATDPAAEQGVFSLGRMLEFTLRPSARYSGELHVSVYAARGVTLTRLEPVIERDPAGGVRVLLETAASPLERGSWELRFYVSPSAAQSLTEAQLRSHACPKDTRCLAFNAQFVSPEAK